MTLTIAADPQRLETAKAVIQSGAVKHIGIIMDGNRRWAKDNALLSQQGHYEGYKALKNIVEFCALTLHLPVLTVYAFSTENWRRPGEEVDFLLQLFHKTLQRELAEIAAKNVKMRFIGDTKAFPQAFQAACIKAEEATQNNSGMLFQVAWNYGGRSEIVHSVQQIAALVKAGTLAPEQITEETIGAHLYTGLIPDPDMIIRTGGEYRLSNFLLWQSAYAELYVLETLWPQFTPDTLCTSLIDFQNRHRRFGK